MYITYEIEFENEIILTTEEHPFWVYGKDFVEASELVEGDEIVVDQDSEEYKLEEIMSIKRHLHEEAIKVYNFVVEDWHTYFIGKSRFWVHNKGCETPDVPNNSVKSYINHNTYNEMRNKLGKECADKFTNSMKKGIVAGEGTNGIKNINNAIINGKSYKYEIKIKGKCGDYRIFGNYDKNSGHIIFNKFGRGLH